jgi:hypothetical protein
MSFSFGQNTAEMAASQEAWQLQLVFDQHEFGDRFAVLAMSDENYDYYVVDLTKLGDTFKRVYFMNLTYNESKLVNLDADIAKDQTWFKTYYTNKEIEITCLFNELKDKTEKAQTDMSTEEESQWMAKFNKFKKESSDE